MFKPQNDLTIADCRALTLVLCGGKSKKKAIEETGLTMHRLNQVLQRDDVKEIAHRAYAEVVESVRALGGVVIEKMRELLESDNEYIVAQMIDKWMRTQAMYTEVKEMRYTAEDIVKQLLDKSQDNTQKGDQMEAAPDTGPVDLTLFDEKEATPQ